MAAKYGNPNIHNVARIEARVDGHSGHTWLRLDFLGTDGNGVNQSIFMPEKLARRVAAAINAAQVEPDMTVTEILEEAAFSRRWQ